MTTRDFPISLNELAVSYREPHFPHRLAGMMRGLRQPRQSKAYKEAMIEVQRLSAPIAAILLPACLVGLLAVISSGETKEDRLIDITISETVEPNTNWQKTENIQTPEKTAADDFTPDIPDIVPSVTVPTETPDQRVTTPSRRYEAVLLTKSPVTLKTLFGDTRTAGSRAELRRRHDGAQSSEDAVMRALRWLKKSQHPDGSWPTQKIAMTGLAVLTYLAHGEKPSDSPEFGETVQRALEFLMRNQLADGRFQGMDSNQYAHPIATYALCEAYGMTLNPNIKVTAERALATIIQGQHPTGGWTYKMDPGMNPEDGKYRDDTSYMGWCAQALKAANMAQIRIAGLDKATKLAVRGFKKNANPNGGFGYTGSGQGGLTGVGTLCMQLLGAAQEPEVTKSLILMDGWRPSADAKSTLGHSLQYYCYYATQAKFHAGGKRWEDWNKDMQALYVKTQQIETDAVKDEQGRNADIGWWTNGDTHSDRPVMDTCLAALQLMVYYRYLPTTSKEAIKVDRALAATSTDTNDIQVITGTL